MGIATEIGQHLLRPAERRLERNLIYFGTGNPNPVQLRRQQMIDDTFASDSGTG